MGNLDTYWRYIPTIWDVDLEKGLIKETVEHEEKVQRIIATIWLLYFVVKRGTTMYYFLLVERRTVAYALRIYPYCVGSVLEKAMKIKNIRFAVYGGD